MPTLTAELWEIGNATKLATLSESFDRRWQDTVSEVGSGQLSLLADDANQSACTIGRVVRFLIDDDPVVAWRIDKREVVSVARGEEADQVVKLSGRGLAAEFDDAVTYPSGQVYPNAQLIVRPWSDLRPFSWATSEVSFDGWPFAVSQFGQTTCIPNLLDPIVGVPPAGWPSPLQSEFVQWIWTRGRALHPAGTCLFRKQFNISGDTTQCALFLSAGGRARALIDGIEVIPWTSSFPTWSSSFTTSVVLPISGQEISLGTHQLAIEAENFDYTGTQYKTPGSVGCVMAALFSIPTDGRFTVTDLICGTDTTWRCLDYPATYPAPTPGQVIGVLRNDAQARGGLVGWTFGGSFGDTTDSNGVPWATSTEQVVRVGDSLLSVLRSLQEQQLIDWRADPVGRRLWVWNWGTSVSDTAVTLAKGSNLLELAHVIEAV